MSALFPVKVNIIMIICTGVTFEKGNFGWFQNLRLFLISNFLIWFNFFSLGLVFLLNQRWTVLLLTPISLAISAVL